MLEAALRYAEIGAWPVFPLAPRGKRPLTGHGFKEATTDRKQIETWWTATPTANIGVPTGPATFDALDIDGPSGEQSYLEMIDGHRMPQAPGQETGRGRQLFLFGGTLGTRARCRPGVDTRGIGGYVCIAPSVHPNGKTYRLTHPGMKPPKPPPWLLKALGDGAQQPALRLVDPQPKPEALPDDIEILLGMAGIQLEVIPEGARNDSLFRIGASLRARGQDLRAIYHMLHLANEHLCSPPLDSAEIQTIGQSASALSVSDAYRKHEAAGVQALQRDVERSVEQASTVEMKEATAGKDAGGIKAALRREFGVAIQALIQVGRDHAQFYIDVGEDQDAAARIYVGRSVLTARPIVDALMRNGYPIDGVKIPSKRWPATLEALLSIRVFEDDSELERQGETWRWVEMIRAEIHRHGTVKCFDTVLRRKAFIDSGWLYVHAESAVVQLHASGRARDVSVADFQGRLKEIGFSRGPNTQGTISVRGEGKEGTASARYWRVLLEACPESDEEPLIGEDRDQNFSDFPPVNNVNT